jgi:hypothetical protein
VKTECRACDKNENISSEFMLFSALRCISMLTGENCSFARHVRYCKRRPNVQETVVVHDQVTILILHVVLFDLVFLGELGDHIGDLNKFLLLRSSS